MGAVEKVSSGTPSRSSSCMLARAWGKKLSAKRVRIPCSWRTRKRSSMRSRSRRCDGEDDVVDRQRLDDLRQVARGRRAPAGRPNADAGGSSPLVGDEAEDAVAPEAMAEDGAGDRPRRLVGADDEHGAVVEAVGPDVAGGDAQGELFGQQQPAREQGKRKSQMRLIRSSASSLASSRKAKTMSGKRTAPVAVTRRIAECLVEHGDGAVRAVAARRAHQHRPRAPAPAGSSGR